MLDERQFKDVGLLVIVWFDTADVVRHLGAEILHQRINGYFELGSCRGWPAKTRSSWIA